MDILQNKLHVAAIMINKQLFKQEKKVPEYDISSKVLDTQGILSYRPTVYRSVMITFDPNVISYSCYTLNLHGHSSVPDMNLLSLFA